MKYLIVNADDFGLTKGVSEGIVEAAANGVVSSTTMLVNTEYFDYSISLLRKDPRLKLGVGVHLNLTYGEPLSKDVPTLVGRNNLFHKEAEFPTKTKQIDPKEIEAEFTAQIEKLLAAGVEITHLDTHQNICRSEKVKKVTASLAQKYHLAVRRTIDPPAGIRTTEKFSDSFRNESASEMNFKLLLKKFEKAESLEMTCHPGYFDVELLEKSRYAKKREIELSVLTKYDLQVHLERNGIELISFAELSAV